MKKDRKIGRDITRIFTISWLLVCGLCGVMLFSPLSEQYVDNGVVRGGYAEAFVDTISDIKRLRNVDSLIMAKKECLPRWGYLDRFLAEEERVDVANARADIYGWQWKRIGILKEMGNRELLVEALNDYCTVIGYNQEKAKTMLDSLESE